MRTTPAKNPRTECCCQPVAFMMAAIVAPLGWLSSAITFSCLEFDRVVRSGFVVAFWRPMLGRALRLGLPLVFGIRMLLSLVTTAH